MKYPKSEQYDKQFLLENMMGPNALKILRRTYRRNQNSRQI